MKAPGLGLWLILVWEWGRVYAAPDYAVVHANTEGAQKSPEAYYKNNTNLQILSQRGSVQAFDLIRKSVQNRLSSLSHSMESSTFTASTVPSSQTTKEPSQAAEEQVSTSLEIYLEPTTTSVETTVPEPTTLNPTTTSLKSSSLPIPVVSSSFTTVTSSKEIKTFTIPVVTITETPMERIETVKITEWITQTYVPSSTLVPATTSVVETNDYKEQRKYLELLMRDLYSSLKENDVEAQTKVVTTPVLTSPVVTTPVVTKPSPAAPLVTSTSLLTTTTSLPVPKQVEHPPMNVQINENKYQPKVKEPVKEPIVEAPEPIVNIKAEKEHGSGAKDILNMKPLPYKVSVAPQFQNHKPNLDPPTKYAKPKIHYTFGPENMDEKKTKNTELAKELDTKELAREMAAKEMAAKEAAREMAATNTNVKYTKADKVKEPKAQGAPEDPKYKQLESMFQSKLEPKELEMFKKIYPELEKLLYGQGVESVAKEVTKQDIASKKPKEITTLTSTSTTSSSVSLHVPTSSTASSVSSSAGPYIYEDEDYIYKYVYAEDEHKNGPLDLLHVPKEEQDFNSEDNPFQTFKSKQDLNEGYRKEQNAKKKEFQDLSKEFESNRPRRQHGTERDSYHKSSQKFNFDIFRFKSSSNKVQIAWFLVLSSVLMPAYL